VLSRYHKFIELCAHCYCKSVGFKEQTITVLIHSTTGMRWLVLWEGHLSWCGLDCCLTPIVEQDKSDEKNTEEDEEEGGDGDREREEKQDDSSDDDNDSVKKKGKVKIYLQFSKPSV